VKIYIVLNICPFSVYLCCA